MSTATGKLKAGDVLEFRPLRVAGRPSSVPAAPADAMLDGVRFVVVERTGNDAGYAVWVRHPPRRECAAPAARTRVDMAP